MSAPRTGTIELATIAATECDGFLPPGVDAKTFFEAASGSSSWVHRRILSIRLREDGCTYVRTSLDLTIPRELAPNAKGSGRPNCAVLLPITWWSKSSEKHRIDIRDRSGGALPLLHSDQQAALAFAFTCAIAARSGARITFGDAETLRSLTLKLIVGNRRAALAARRDLLIKWSEVVKGAQVTEALTRFTQLFVGSFLVAVALPYAPDGARTIVKYNFGLGPWELKGPGPRRRRGVARLREALIERTGLIGRAWLVTPWIDFEDADVTVARSTHFEGEVTGGALIRNVQAVVGPRVLKVGPPGIRSIAHLEMRTDEFPTGPAAPGQRGASVLWRLLVVPRWSAQTNSARFISLFAFGTLAFFAALSVAAWGLTVPGAADAIDPGFLVSAIGLARVGTDSTDFTQVVQSMTGLMAVAALWAGRNAEHAVTAWVLRPFRWIVLFSGINLGIVAILITPLRLPYWWVVALPALVVEGYLVSRDSRIQAHVRASGALDAPGGWRER